MHYHWVKKNIPVKEWKNYYSQYDAYTFLHKQKSGIDIGFLAIKINDDCEEITDLEDLRIMDLHRRPADRRPFPLEKEK